jgi:hypothetical protein
MHDRGMTLMQAGLYGTVPYIVGVILELFFGRLSDRIRKLPVRLSECCL